MQKKAYQKPVLQHYGKVAQVTLGRTGSGRNTEVPT